MTQGALFMWLLTTGLMVIGGVRELSYRRYAMSATLIFVPMAGWLSVLWGK